MQAPVKQPSEMPGVEPLGQVGPLESHVTGAKQRPGATPSGMQNAKGLVHSGGTGSSGAKAAWQPPLRWNAVQAGLREQVSPSNACAQSTALSTNWSVGKQPRKSVRQSPAIAQNASFTIR